MRLVLRAFGYPLLQHRLLLRLEFLVRTRRGHPLLFVVGQKQPFDELALVGFARHNRLFVDRRRAVVEPQLRLACGTIRPVAGETILGENRPNIAVELKFAIGADRRSASENRDQSENTCHRCPFFIGEEVSVV